MLSETLPEKTAIAAVMCLAFETRIAAGAGVTVICNGRRERLRDLIACACGRASGLISFGVAGGLDRALRPGQWVIASGIVSQSGRFPTDERWSRALCGALPDARYADISGLDAPLASSVAKLALGRKHGTVAVDTESHVVAEVATRWRIPFVAARVVLDPAWRSLPQAALVPLNPDGTADVGGVARCVVRTPSQLVGLGQVSADAFRAWCALRRGRASLGSLFAFCGPAGEPDTAAAANVDQSGSELAIACTAQV